MPELFIDLAHVCIASGMFMLAVGGIVLVVARAV